MVAYWFFLEGNQSAFTVIINVTYNNSTDNKCSKQFVCIPSPQPLANLTSFPKSAAVHEIDPIGPIC